MLDDVQKTIRATRRKLIAEINKSFEPHMWESGYRIGKVGESRSMKVWRELDKQGEHKVTCFNGFKLDEFYGFSEAGVITDIYCGCVTESLSSYPLEDLMLLHKWATKKFAKQEEAVAA